MLSFDKENTVQRMMSFIDQIFPLQRMINSEGLDDSFEIVPSIFPDTIIHEYPSGMICGDWTVPKGWKVVDAWLKDSKGNEITNFKNHPLFVAAYSEAIDGKFSKKEIEKHLRCHPTKPDAYFLEHRNAYNYQLVDWGITLPGNLWETLNDEDEYHVHIHVEWSDRSMKVAEVFIPGESENVISISAHIDELCNDNLSGCTVGFEIIKYIAQLPSRKYSYQLLLLPETIGTFFYVYNNMDRVKKTIGMYNLETVGGGENWVLKKAFTENSYIEKVLEAALINQDCSYKKIDFFDGYGNDERVYEWPTLGIPGVALQRYPFAAYHSSDDIPENIDRDLLYDAFKISRGFIDILEKDYIPEYTEVIPPWLSKNDLYYDSKDDTSKFHKFNNLVLFNINGKNKISDIARLADLSFDEVYNYLEKFSEKRFLKKNPCY